jgi:hypothetical protein
MAKKPSRYEKNFRTLGCTPYTELLSESDLDEADSLVESLGHTPTSRKSQKEIKRLVAQKRLPALLTLGDTLYITDETGEGWRGPLEAKQALLKLGFSDGDAQMASEAKKSFH